jgi:hypothetical protein
MDISLLVRYLSFCAVVFRKKRLKNKDIAFYASLNSDLAKIERELSRSERRNINCERNFISSCNWAEKNFRCWLEIALDGIGLKGMTTCFEVICGSSQFESGFCGTWTWITCFPVSNVNLKIYDKFFKESFQVLVSNLKTQKMLVNFEFLLCFCNHIIVCCIWVIIIFSIS